MIGARPPSPPEPPRRRAEALWRRLAEDQDAALAAEELARGQSALGLSETRAGVVAAALPAAVTTETSSFVVGPAGARRRRRSRLGHRPALAVGGAAATVALAAAVALFAWAPRKPALSVQVGSASGRAAAPVPSLVADARADLPMRFSDGSAVTFRAGSAGRLASLSRSGAEIILERGALEAHVIHAASTAWIVRAGPYRVRVTGTRFAVTWRAERLDLALYEGSVIVDGAVLGAGVPLQAGRRLTVASGVVRIEPFGATAALAAGGAGSPQSEGEGDGEGSRQPEGDVGEPGASATGRKGPANVGPAGPAAAGSTEDPADSGSHDPGTVSPPSPQGRVADRPSDATASRTLARLDAAPVKDLLSGRLAGGTSDADVPIGRAAGDGARGGDGDGARTDSPRSRRSGPGRRDPATESRHKRHARAAGASADEAWLALAEHGRYPEALASARRLGWSDLCRRLDAHHLLTLADVARYSGARAPARRAFEALARRFPHDRLAADAVFSLGRMAFEAGRPGEAARWFHRYGADWPNGPLGDEAAGRLVESAIRLDDTMAARAAARAYLARAPNGAQAALARGVLADPPDGAP